MAQVPRTLHVWRDHDRRLTDVGEDAVVAALTAHGRRRVRRDGTLSVGGVDWETDQSFLAGRLVRVERSLAEPSAPPVIMHEDQRYELRLVDAVRNGKQRAPFKPKPGIDAVEFDPTQVVLDGVFGRLPRKVTP